MRQAQRRALSVALGLGAVAALVVASACTSGTPASSPAPAASVIAAPAATAISLAPPVADAGASTTTVAPPSDAPIGELADVAYLPDGTLLTLDANNLVEVTRDGKVTRVAAPENGLYQLEKPPGRSIAAGTEKATRLITLSPLREVYKSTRDVQFLSTPHPDALIVPNGDDYSSGATVVSLSTDGTRTFPLAPPAEGAIVRTVHSVYQSPSHTLAVVTFEASDADASPKTARFRAFSYDLQNGHRLAEVMPDGSMNLPESTFVGEEQIIVHDRTIARIDPRTGAVLKKASFPCPKISPDDEMVVTGQPLVDPNGKRVLATCNGDGLVFDAATLTLQRKLKRLVPGCDNGYELPGGWKDGKTFVIEGCGGEAHLDVTTGRYSCSDEDHLIGVPYDMGLGSGPHPPVQHVPMCTLSNVSNTGAAIKLSAHYSITYDENGGRLLVGPHLKKPLTDSDKGIDVAPDETRLVMTKGSHLVELALPAGTVLRDIAL